MKYWITKYALTEGITVLDIPAKPSEEGYLSYTEHDPWHDHFYLPRDWHSSLKCAVNRAEEMRNRKIASLKKQIAKLERTQFAARSPNTSEGE